MFPYFELGRLILHSFPKIRAEPAQPTFFSKIWVEPAQSNFFQKYEFSRLNIKKIQKIELSRIGFQKNSDLNSFFSPKICFGRFFATFGLGSTRIFDIWV